MEKHISEVLSGESLTQDVFSSRGLLLLKAGTVLNPNLKTLLRKHCVTKVMVKGGAI